MLKIAASLKEELEACRRSLDRLLADFREFRLECKPKFEAMARQLAEWKRQEHHV